MLLPQGAMPRVSPHARIDAPVLTDILSELARSESHLTRTLRQGFRSMEQRQQELATLLCQELAAQPPGELQTLTYFLSVVVYLCFWERFGSRVSSVSRQQLCFAADHLILDGSIRNNRRRGPGTFSDDILACAQPTLMGFIRDELSRVGADNQVGTTAPVGTLTLLVLALSLSVPNPCGQRTVTAD